MWWVVGSFLVTAILIFLGSLYADWHKRRLQQWHDEDMASLKKWIEQNSQKKGEYYGCKAQRQEGNADEIQQ